MKSKTLIAAAMMIGCTSAAFAGAGILTTVVTPLSNAVTYSRSATPAAPALDTFIGYTVTVRSDPSNTNTINNVAFTGTISATDLQEGAAFASADGATCQTTANPPGAAANAVSIRCSIGQLRAGQAFPTFAVFFKAPVKDTASPTPDGVAGSCGTTDCVAFSGITYYAEGTGGVQSPPQNSTVLWAAASVTLGTANPILVKSGMQKSGGSLFTGNGAVATTADPWTTAVVVPSGFIAPNGATYTTAEINETEGLPTCAADLLTCNISQLTIPGAFAKLTITLRRDVSTIARSAKIGSAKIFYKDPTTPDFRITYPYELLPCTDTTWGPLPQVAIPCINKRTEYTKKNAPTPDWIGDWEFEIFALDNGKYEN